MRRIVLRLLYIRAVFLGSRTNVIFRFLADLDFQYLLFREPKRPKGLFGQNRQEKDKKDKTDRTDKTGETSKTDKT